MDVFGSLRKLTKIVFPTNSGAKNVELQAANQTGAGTIVVSIPDVGDTAGTLVELDASQTLTNKTIDGDVNTVQDLPVTAIKTVLADANKALVRDASGIPTSALIVNTNVDASAAITRSKLASGTASHVIINDGSGVLSSEAQLATSRGGTNISTYTTGDFLYASASNVLSKLPIGTTGQLLRVSAGGVPEWFTGAGTGDVVGPASATSTNIATFNGTSGKLIQDSGASVASGVMTVGTAYHSADGSASAPGFSFSGATNTGIWRNGTILQFTVAGVTYGGISSSGYEADRFRANAAGSVTSPSFYRNGENTGLYFPAANQLGVVCNGVNIGTFSSTALTTTVPSRNPDGTAGSPSFSFSGATGTGMWRNGTTLSFAVAGTTYAGISSAGVESDRFKLNAAGSTSGPAVYRSGENTGLYFPAANQLGVVCNGTNTASFSTTATTSGVPYYMDATTPAHFFRSGSGVQLRTSTGTVGAGANILEFYSGGTSPSSLGSEYGGVEWTGSAVAVYTVSDERLKENIESFPDGSLAKILALRPVSFTWKEESGIQGGGVSRGFIAQEFQQVLPDAVSANGNYLTITKDELIAHLVKAVQELEARVKALEPAP